MAGKSASVSFAISIDVAVAEIATTGVAVADTTGVAGIAVTSVVDDAIAVGVVVADAGVEGTDSLLLSLAGLAKLSRAKGRAVFLAS